MPSIGRKLADYFFTGINLMLSTIQATRDQLDPNTGGHRERAIREAFVRATAWIRTLSKLNHASDLQAIWAISRSLLEIAVDLALLHADKTDGSAKALLGFEQSQKLTGANKYKAYIDRTKRTVPAHCQPLIDFAATRTPSIKADRQRLWGTDRHPDRWTGAKKSLRDDAQAADEAKCACWSHMASLEEVYAECNARQNWFAHGSGAAAFRGVEDLDPGAALGFKECLTLAEICLKIIWHEFPMQDQPEIRAAIDALAEHSKAAERLDQEN